MKKIIHPAVNTPEEVAYFCDITGEEMTKWGPAATLVVDCGYSSNRDGLQYTLHLSQAGLDKVMMALKSTLPVGTKMGSFVCDCMSRDYIETYPEDL